MIFADWFKLGAIVVNIIKYVVIFLIWDLVCEIFGKKGS